MAGELESLAYKGWLYHPDYPDHWKRRPLYSLAEWVNGLAFRDIQFSPSGMPVIKIAEIKGGISGQTKFTEQAFDESVRVRPGDLLFSWSGQPETSIDAFWWRGPEGWLNQHVFRVTPADGIDPTFFYYLLRYLKSNFVGIARNKQTTGLGHVTKRDLENIEAAYPELPEQRAIAHILGTLDDKIELNRRMSETLEAMARALFKSWFVDFDPVRAKVEGRWRKGESLPGLPAHLYDLFPERFVDSELGEIPEGWEAGTLGDFSALNPEVWTSQTRPPEIKYVDLSNTKWGRIELVTTHQASDAPSRAQRVLRAGDTIVGTVRPGNGSYALISEPGLTGSTGFAVLRPTGARYAEFVYLTATGADNIDTLAHLADGAAYPAVRPEVVAATPIVRPTDEVLGRFSGVAGPLLAKIAHSDMESRTLAALRDALLPNLISGELRVREAERFLIER
jgi:type I restriction enzyme S subunit